MLDSGCKIDKKLWGWDELKFLANANVCGCRVIKKRTWKSEDLC
jgi:hypothetical protein